MKSSKEKTAFLVHIACDKLYIDHVNFDSVNFLFSFLLGFIFLFD